MNKRFEEKYALGLVFDYFPDEVALMQQTIKLFEFMDDYQEINYQSAEKIINDLCRIIEKKGLVAVMTNFRILSISEKVTNALNVSALLVACTAFSGKIIPIMSRGILGLMHSIDSIKDSRLNSHLMDIELKRCMESTELYNRYLLLISSDEMPRVAAEVFLSYVHKRYQRINREDIYIDDRSVMLQELMVCDSYERIVFNCSGKYRSKHLVAMRQISNMTGIFFTDTATTTLKNMFLAEMLPSGI